MRGSTFELNGHASNSSPALLLFLHLPKTGGTVMKSVVSALPGWKLLCPHWRGDSYGRRIVAALADALDPHAQPALASSHRLFAWREARVMVEFHLASELVLFQRTFRPRLAELAAAYKREHGRFLAATIIRDPLEQTRSHFAYFQVYGGWAVSPRAPVSWRTNASLQAEGFARWLSRQRTDPQTKALSDGAARDNETVPLGDLAGRTLAALGGVGRSEELEPSIRAILSRVGVCLSSNLSAASCNTHGARRAHLISALPEPTLALLQERTRAARGLYAAYTSSVEQRVPSNALLAPSWHGEHDGEVAQRVPCRTHAGDAVPIFRATGECHYR